MREGNRKVTLALKHASDAATSTGSLMQVIRKMSDRQRKLFLEISKGKDEVEALLVAMPDHFGIVRKLYLKDTGDGEHRGILMETIIKYPERVHELDEMSYERLMRIARSAIVALTGTADYRDYLIDINDFFKMVAPEAFAVVSEIMGNSKAKDEVRLKAATVILDRAGYKEATPEQGNEMPVKLTLNFAQPTFTVDPVKVGADVVEGDDGAE